MYKLGKRLVLEVNPAKNSIEIQAKVQLDGESIYYLDMQDDFMNINAFNVVTQQTSMEVYDEKVEQIYS